LFDPTLRTSKISNLWICCFKNSYLLLLNRVEDLSSRCTQLYGKVLQF
jgi:hypothetical protein